MSSSLREFNTFKFVEYPKSHDAQKCGEPDPTPTSFSTLGYPVPAGKQSAAKHIGGSKGRRKSRLPPLRHSKRPADWKVFTEITSVSKEHRWPNAVEEALLPRSVADTKGQRDTAPGLAVDSDKRLQENNNADVNERTAKDGEKADQKCHADEDDNCLSKNKLDTAQESGYESGSLVSSVSTVADEDLPTTDVRKAINGNVKSIFQAELVQGAHIKAADAEPIVSLNGRGIFYEGNQRKPKPECSDHHSTQNQYAVSIETDKKVCEEINSGELKSGATLEVNAAHSDRRKTGRGGIRYGSINRDDSQSRDMRPMSAPDTSIRDEEPTFIGQDTVLGAKTAVLEQGNKTRTPSSVFSETNVLVGIGSHSQPPSFLPPPDTSKSDSPDQREPFNSPDCKAWRWQDNFSFIQENCCFREAAVKTNYSSDSSIHNNLAKNKSGDHEWINTRIPKAAVVVPDTIEHTQLGGYLPCSESARPVEKTTRISQVDSQKAPVGDSITFATTVGEYGGLSIEEENISYSSKADNPRRSPLHDAGISQVGEPGDDGGTRTQVGVCECLVINGLCDCHNGNRRVDFIRSLAGRGINYVSSEWLVGRTDTSDVAECKETGGEKGEAGQAVSPIGNALRERNTSLQICKQPHPTFPLAAVRNEADDNFGLKEGSSSGQVEAAAASSFAPEQSAETVPFMHRATSFEALKFQEVIEHPAGGERGTHAHVLGDNEPWPCTPPIAFNNKHEITCENGNLRGAQNEQTKPKGRGNRYPRLVACSWLKRANYDGNTRGQNGSVVRPEKVVINVGNNRGKPVKYSSKVTPGRKLRAEMGCGHSSKLAAAGNDPKESEPGNLLNLDIVSENNGQEESTGSICADEETEILLVKSGGECEVSGDYWAGNEAVGACDTGREGQCVENTHAQYDSIIDGGDGSVLLMTPCDDQTGAVLVSCDAVQDHGDLSSATGEHNATIDIGLNERTPSLHQLSAVNLKITATKGSADDDDGTSCQLAGMNSNDKINSIFDSSSDGLFSDLPPPRAIIGDGLGSGEEVVGTNGNLVVGRGGGEGSAISGDVYSSQEPGHIHLVDNTHMDYTQQLNDTCATADRSIAAVIYHKDYDQGVNTVVRFNAPQQTAAAGSTRPVIHHRSGFHPQDTSPLLDHYDVDNFLREDTNRETVINGDSSDDVEEGVKEEGNADLVGDVSKTMMVAVRTCPSGRRALCDSNGDGSNGVMAGVNGVMYHPTPSSPGDGDGMQQQHEQHVGIGMDEMTLSLIQDFVNDVMPRG